MSRDEGNIAEALCLRGESVAIHSDGQVIQGIARGDIIHFRHLEECEKHSSADGGALRQVQINLRRAGQGHRRRHA